jgi:hypothetical protein
MGVRKTKSSMVHEMLEGFSRDDIGTSLTVSGSSEKGSTNIDRGFRGVVGRITVTTDGQNTRIDLEHE